MLERLYEDVTDFSFPEERFERVYAEVERTLFEKSLPATVLVAVHGIEMEADRVELGDGLELRARRPDRRPRPGRVGRRRPGEPGRPAACSPARSRPRTRCPWRRHACASAGRSPACACGRPAAWRSPRSGGGAPATAAGHPFELEATGAARGEPWILVDGEEAELRQFVDVVEGVSRGGSVAWALSRFEMGCGRRLESEALSDYLLGAARARGEQRRDRAFVAGAARGGALRRGGRAQARPAPDRAGPGAGAAA